MVIEGNQETSSVFNNGPGKVNWFYDAKDKTVTLVIKEENNRIVTLNVESLVPQTTTPQLQNFLLRGTYYSHHSLSRLNNDELESTKSTEEMKALNLMTELYGRDYLVQYGFLGSSKE